MIKSGSNDSGGMTAPGGERTFYIFAAGEYSGLPPVLSGERFVIAADGGLDRLRRWGIVPDLAVGDFDSLRGELPRDVETVRHPVMKDDTDTALAASEALRRGARRIVVYGALGGRLDHSFANLQLLAGLSRRKIEAYLIGSAVTVTALTAARAAFAARQNGLFSVFAYGGKALVSEKGSLYTLDRFAMRDDVTRGISNEFTGGPVEITVHSGTAFVMWDSENGTFMPEITEIQEEKL